MQLHILFSRLQSAPLNLAYEQYLLLHREKNPTDMYLLFYENLPAIILGTSLQTEQEVYLHKKHPPILRRMSGGGSVCHFRGNLNYALFASLEQWPQLFPVPDSYRQLVGAIAREIGAGAAMQGLSDISRREGGVWRKISGNSQARKRGWLLHHGTIIYELTQAGIISYFLKQPQKQPEYRQNRSHRLFMATTLPCHSRSLLVQKISGALAKTFNLQRKFHHLTVRQQLTELYSAGLSAVVAEKVKL